MLIDTHCHLDFPELHSDIDGVLARAREAGVSKLISISTRVAQFPALLSLAERYANVFCTAGTHPHHSNEEAERGVSLEQLMGLTRHPKVVGIGEAGLDYHYDYSPRDIQEKSFRLHIAAARETGLPLVIHAREADEDIGDILEEEMARGPFSAVLHCYSSGEKLAERGLDMGFYLSFSGILTFKNAKIIQKIAQNTPENRFLVETDAPYLAPVPHRGSTNEPAFVRHTAEFLAALRGVAYEAIAKRSTQNALALFRKMPA